MQLVNVYINTETKLYVSILNIKGVMTITLGGRTKGAPRKERIKNIIPADANGKPTCNILKINYDIVWHTYKPKLDVFIIRRKNKKAKSGRQKSKCSRYQQLWDFYLVDFPNATNRKLLIWTSTLWHYM